MPRADQETYLARDNLPLVLIPSFVEHLLSITKRQREGARMECSGFGVIMNHLYVRMMDSLWMTQEEYDEALLSAFDRVLEELSEPGMAATIPPIHQATADAIWAAIIEACDAYFLNGVTQWAGDSRAPEFTDKQVADQFNRWSDYQLDSGAMHWRDNMLKSFHFDFNALPDGWKRAVCERVWVICKEAKLDEDPDYQKSIETYMKDYRV